MLLPLFLYAMLIPYNTTHKHESRFKESETKSSSGKVNSVTDICMQLSHWQPNSPPLSSATLLYSFPSLQESSGFIPECKSCVPDVYSV